LAIIAKKTSGLLSFSNDLHSLTVKQQRPRQEIFAGSVAAEKNKKGALILSPLRNSGDYSGFQLL
jgi:hypothetical protein